MRIVVMLLVLAGAGAGRGEAQELREAGFARWDALPSGPAGPVTLTKGSRPSVGVLVVGGLMGAAVATGAAAAIVNFDTDACAEPPCDPQALTALGLATVLPPLGVHLGNRRRGNFALTWLASTAAGALMGAGVAAAGEVELIPLIPVAQIAAAVVTEIAVARRAERRARRVP